MGSRSIDIYKLRETLMENQKNYFFDSPKLSVVVKTHNDEKRIIKCLQALSKQTVEEIEIIVVDDNSTDATYSLACTYSEVDNRVKVFRNKNDLDISKIVKSKNVVLISAKKIIGKNFVKKVLNKDNAINGFFNCIKIFLKQVFSISIFDGHVVVFICGLQIRSKLKRRPIFNNVSEYGLNKNNRPIKLIVSLTTFPERIITVKETVKSLLLQTCKPDELILWLAKEQFPNGVKSLPKDLLDLEKFGLSIKWCNDIKSYKKLIPALKEYPNDIIITFDDDIYYDNNIVENLYKSYLKHPNCISTNRGWRLKFKNNKINTLKTAQLYWTRFKDKTFKNTIIGCGGVLYPPHCLAEEVVNENKFMSILPTQDDIWFWAMAVLNNTPIRVVASYDINLVTVENTQQHGLCKINKKHKKGMTGSIALATIIDKYPQIVEKIKKEGENV